jgi:hypothetical protein
MAYPIRPLQTALAKGPSAVMHHRPKVRLPKPVSIGSVTAKLSVNGCEHQEGALRCNCFHTSGGKP